MAIIARQLAAQLKAENPDLANLSPARALFAHLKDFRTIVVGGECYTIEDNLRALGGLYLPTSREWLFENPDHRTLLALCELIVPRNLITLKLSNGAPSRRISMASIS